MGKETFAIDRSGSVGAAPEESNTRHTIITVVMDTLAHSHSHSNSHSQLGGEQECKIVLVGDSKCGKTALVHRVLHDKFLEMYVPTGFERYTAVYEVGSKRINFTVWDTAGSSAYDTVRPLAYQDAQVFLLCFQINQPDSLVNTVNKWYPEVRQHAPNVPVILCGCQSDTRHDSDTQLKTKRAPICSDMVTATFTKKRGVETSRQIGASTYVETSSKLSGKSAQEAFEVAALAALGRLNKNHQGTISRDHSTNIVRCKDRTRSCSVM